MSQMISSSLKPIVTKVINPVARLALRFGLTPNIVTLLGTVGLVSSALYFLPHGRFFAGSLAITLFSLSDLFDGAMARLSNLGASKWGAFLDSTLDRISDAAIHAGVAIYLIKKDEALAFVVIFAMVLGFLISYIRAKAEGLGIECTVGIAERTERLTIALFAIGLYGLGISVALVAGFWLLTILGLITVIQRVLVVKRATS
jgi:CDP-diacylglycerol--glycerol-3-phosphate 3-phosphatidyltransferase